MSTRIANDTSRTSFDEVVLPHLDAAYKLARWLTRNEHDAEDVVQEASLRAFRYLQTFSGSNARGWFLRIVRNTCYGSFGRGPLQHTDVFDEEQHSCGELTDTPETLMLQAANAMLIEQALSDLPGRFRELIVRREIEGWSYQELADGLGIPMGPVMSGLSRARQAFHRALSVRLEDTNHWLTRVPESRWARRHDLKRPA
jgi:RNA polymerase sigma-70 factor (ECF subfamily)